MKTSKCIVDGIVRRIEDARGDAPSIYGKRNQQNDYFVRFLNIHRMQLHIHKHSQLDARQHVQCGIQSVLQLFVDAQSFRIQSILNP